MPTEKTGEFPQSCNNPEHYPSETKVYEPGTYVHTCPGCGHVMHFVAPLYFLREHRIFSHGR